MPKVASVQTNFTAGELSPRLIGRNDLAKYGNGLREERNFVSQKHGGTIRRSGTQFVAATKDSSKKARLIEFVFSVQQTYVLEFGHLYIRFFRNKGRLEHGTIHTVATASWTSSVATISTTATHDITVGSIVSVQGIVTNDPNFTGKFNGTFVVTAIPTPSQVSYALTASPGTYVSGGTIVKVGAGGQPTEIATPYTESDLALLKWTQSADVVYFTHPNHEPRKLARNAGADADPTTWSLSRFSAVKGPFLDIVSESAAVLTTPIGAPGASVTITWSAGSIPFLNDGRGLQPTDVGRLVLWQRAASENWTWAKITAVTNELTAVVTVNTATSAGTTIDWALGAWGDTNGWPRCSTFHKSRLWFGSTNLQPQSLFASRIDNFRSFEEFQFAGGTSLSAVFDDHALQRTVDDDQVNTIHWIKSDARGLAILTDGGAFLGSGRDEFDPITPTSFTVTRQLTDGVDEQSQPHRVGSVLLFVRRAARKVVEYVFRFEDERFVGPDLSILADHITLTGIVDTAYQAEPDNVLWCARADGLLLGMTYERSEEVVAWHRHALGGTLDGENQPAVESIAVIRDGADDLLWMIVRRTILGVTKRYVEFMRPLFPDDASPEDAFFVDSGLSLNNPITIQQTFQTNPVEIDAPAHPFANGDRVRIRGVKGMSEINDRTFLVTEAVVNRFKLQYLDTTNVDGTGFGVYVSGGAAYKAVTVVGGLGHLEGQTVQVLGDGAVQPDAVVDGFGQITLAQPASFVQAGLGYLSRIQTMPIIPKTPFESRGAIHRVLSVSLYLNRTIGGKAGTPGYLDEIVTRQPVDPMDAGPPLFSGLHHMAVSGRHAQQVEVVVEADQPLPMNLLSIVTRLQVDEV